MILFPIDTCFRHKLVRNSSAYVRTLALNFMVLPVHRVVFLRFAFGVPFRFWAVTPVTRSAPAYVALAGPVSPVSPTIHLWIMPIWAFLVTVEHLLKLVREGKYDKPLLLMVIINYLHASWSYYPGQKKRTIIEIRGEKNAVPRVISGSIRRDQRRASPIRDCPRLLPCADRAWSSMISHVEQRSSGRESRGWFFFMARVVDWLTIYNN